MTDFLETHLEFKEREFRQYYFADQLRLFVAVTLRNIRQDRGLTQEQVGEAAGLTQSQIARIEDPDDGMSLETMVRAFDGLALVPRISLVPYSMDAALPPTDTGSVT